MTKQQAESECVAISGPRGSISIPLNALSGDEEKDYELIAALAEVICGPSEMDDDQTQEPSLPRPPRVSSAAPAASTSTAPTVEKAEPTYEYQRRWPRPYTSAWTAWRHYGLESLTAPAALALRELCDRGYEVTLKHFAEDDGKPTEYRRVER